MHVQMSSLGRSGTNDSQVQGTGGRHSGQAETGERIWPRHIKQPAEALHTRVQPDPEPQQGARHKGLRREEHGEDVGLNGAELGARDSLVGYRAANEGVEYGAA